MKYRYSLSLFIAAIICFGNPAIGQIVGTDVFLQGHWLEVGEDQMGAFGTCSTPVGYHAHGCCGTAPCATSGAATDVTYDWGHDGWDVGAPCFMGPYTIPGFPQEGWSIEVAGTEYRNWASGGTCTGDFAVPGSIPLVGGYSNTGGTITGTWTGGVAGLYIVQESRVDTEASWVVVTTRMYNTTTSPITDVYYERTCDPDNGSFWDDGSTTENVIVHQNEDARHDVMIATYAPGTGFTTPADTFTRYNTYMALATKDCRAKCAVIPGLEPSNPPDQLWHNTGTVITALGDSNYEDEGIVLVFNVGTITAGDSAIVSYAYVYNDNTGIDSALPEPLLVVDGAKIPPSGPAPLPTIDTIKPCLAGGSPIVTVNILNATDKDWSWSTWTWSPSTGLSATTGVNVTINSIALAGPTTYTITGTDSMVDMYSCAHRVMYLTVIPCLSVTSNSSGPEGTTSTSGGSTGTVTDPGPGWGAGSGALCLYDSLTLAAHGDSTDATYYWYGPAGFTSTGQYTFRTGLSMADTGWYKVIKTVSVGSDTDSTYVVFNPTPVVTASSNSPVCSQATLSLSATPDSAAELFSWTGPQAYTSSLQNPSITDVSVKDSGLYKVVTTLYGCVDSNFVYVVIDSTPAVPIVSNNSPGAPGVSHCPGDTLMIFSSDATPDVSYAWAGPMSFSSTEQNPIILNAQPVASGVYTVTISSIGTICTSFAVTTVSITPTPPLVATNNGPVCTGLNDTLRLQAESLPGATYSWTGPYTFFSLNQYPYRTPMVAEYAGIYQVVAMLNGCPSATVNDTVVARLTPAPPGVPFLTFCQGYNAPQLQAMGDSIQFYPSATSTVGSLTPPVPSTANVGQSWYYVSQTLNTCTSAIDSISVTIIPKPTITITPDVSLCPHDTAVLTVVDTDPFAYYHWSPSTYLSDTSTASVITRPEAGIHYTVVASNQFGCADTAHVAVSVFAGALLYLGDSVTLYPGQTYQVNPATNCTTFEWFPPAGLDNAHIADPVASPEISTKYIVNAETSWGCTAVDSLDIIINPESSLALPNAFTPGTGPNNEFKIIVRGIATLKYFRVWDRWGNNVFETIDISKGWDGTFNGTPQPFGVYVYEVSAVTSEGTPFVKHGNITLIR